VLLLATVQLSGEQVEEGELQRRLNLDFSTSFDLDFSAVSTSFESSLEASPPNVCTRSRLLSAAVLEQGDGAASLVRRPWRGDTREVVGGRAWWACLLLEEPLHRRPIHRKQELHAILTTFRRTPL
jgi:hypothetical protein